MRAVRAAVLDVLGEHGFEMAAPEDEPVTAGWSPGLSPDVKVLVANPWIAWSAPTRGPLERHGHEVDPYGQGDK